MSAIDVVYLCILAVLGAAVGSFLNVVVWRGEKGISAAGGRSFCPACGHTLSPAELVPVFSWLVLRGRCRVCGGRISPRYPAVEALSSLLFALSYLCSAPLAAGLVFAGEYSRFIASLLISMFASALIVASLTDIDTGEIPNGCAVFVAALAVVKLALLGFSGWESALLGLLAAAGPLLLLALIMNAFGGGDIKLMAAAGMFLGLKAAVAALVIGIVVGGLWGAALLYRREKGKQAVSFGLGAWQPVTPVKDDTSERIDRSAAEAEEKTASAPDAEVEQSAPPERNGETQPLKMPFGPALAVGCFVGALFGERLVQLYLSLF